jgi:hypothetical protein
MTNEERGQVLEDLESLLDVDYSLTAGQSKALEYVISLVGRQEDDDIQYAIDEMILIKNLVSICHGPSIDLAISALHQMEVHPHA